jgi:hypothetical protein
VDSIGFPNCIKEGPNGGLGHPRVVSHQKPSKLMTRARFPFSRSNLVSVRSVFFQLDISEPRASRFQLGIEQGRATAASRPTIRDPRRGSRPPGTAPSLWAEMMIGKESDAQASSEPRLGSAGPVASGPQVGKIEDNARDASRDACLFSNFYEIRQFYPASVAAD